MTKRILAALTVLLLFLTLPACKKDDPAAQSKSAQSGQGQSEPAQSESVESAQSDSAASDIEGNIATDVTVDEDDVIQPLTDSTTVTRSIFHFENGALASIRLEIESDDAALFEQMKETYGSLNYTVIEDSGTLCAMSADEAVVEGWRSMAESPEALAALLNGGNEGN